MKNIIILGIIGAVLLIGGFVVFMNTTEPPTPIVSVEDTTDTTTENDSEPTENAPEESGSISQTETTTTEVKPTPTYSAEFNTALKNARQASLNKDYSLAITYYQEALAIKNADVVHADLYALFLVLNEPVSAKESVLRAIELNPSYTEYWNWLLILEKERFNATFAELKAIYNDGLAKADPKTKVNLVTYFARMAGDMGQYSDAITYWKLAITLNPANKSAYEEEIAQLEAKLSAQ